MLKRLDWCSTRRKNVSSQEERGQFFIANNTEAAGRQRFFFLLVVEAKTYIVEGFGGTRQTGRHRPGGAANVTAGLFLLKEKYW